MFSGGKPSIFLGVNLLQYTTDGFVPEVFLIIFLKVETLEECESSANARVWRTIR